MTEGPGAPAPVLVLSWDDQETAKVHWSLLRLCQRWQLKAVYKATSTKLHLDAAGHPISLGPAQPWFGGSVQAAAVPVYQAWWDIPNPGDLQFFMEHCRKVGIFILLPAVNKTIFTSLRPIVARLY